MEKCGFLSNIEAWNLLLGAYARTAEKKEVYKTMDRISEHGSHLNLDSFKAITNALASSKQFHSYNLAIYDYWREFVRHYPRLQPDIELINKLLYCCKGCRDMERAFYFWNIIEQCKLEPTLGTIEELLMVIIIALYLEFKIITSTTVEPLK